MSEPLTSKDLVVGGFYNWKGQPERLSYIGAQRYNGDSRTWHQFALVDVPGVCWCEVLDWQLNLFEVTERAAVQAAQPEAVGEPTSEPKLCGYCDGTGDVHSPDGEWRGRCSCPAGGYPTTPYPSAPTPEPMSAPTAEPVAFEMYNPATGHAIVDYSRQTHVGRLTAEMGYEARPLVYAAAPHCEPQPAVTDDGFCEWVCPTPKGYLMQCCDCGLIHEVEFRVAQYAPRPSEDFTVVEDENLQAQLRMRRHTSPVTTTSQALEALDELESAARGDEPFNHAASSVIRAALKQALATPPSAATPEPSDAERYRAAISQVCEGYTLPPAVRKILESVLWGATKGGKL